MIKYFVKQWEDCKEEVREYFKTHKQSEYATNYEDILGAVLNCINSHNGREIFNTEKLETIDYGDYQGTLIITFCEETYQPNENETYYTVVGYGSCSGCDTLLAISEYEDGYPNEEQVNDYMALALHLIQRIKCFGEESKFEKEGEM